MNQAEFALRSYSAGRTPVASLPRFTAAAGGPIGCDLALKNAERVGLAQGIPRSAAASFGGFRQPKYSVPNQKMVEAVNLMAKTEGILLDPVYTGKAVAGLTGLSRAGCFKKGEKILFVHTGGPPGLYAYIKPVLGLEAVAD